MVSLFDLDNKARSYSSRAVRILENPAPGTYAKIRSLLGIKHNSITQQQAFLLWVGLGCCRCRHGLNRLEIYKTAIALLEEYPGRSLNVIALMGGVYSPQELLIQIQAETGRKIGERTLYLWGKKNRTLPVYSKRRTYSAGQLARYINYAKSLQRQRKKTK